MRSKTWTNSTGKSPVTRWCDGRGQANGPLKGSGRKPVKQGEETVTVSLRMTPEQRAKLARLGGNRVGAD